MTLAWRSSLPAGQKFVLLALCDNANDQGTCYPSISTLAAKCSMGERTVQGHITAMEELGIVFRELRRGRNTVYHLYASHFPAPAESAPPQNPHHPPAKSAPPPPQNLPKTPAEFAPITTKEPSGKPLSNRQAARGTRLPEDWTLPPAWEEWAMANRNGWTIEHVREVGAMFRDYWVGLSGQKATKTDWAATWRNWCRNARNPEQARIARGGPAWWSTDELVAAKAAELGLTPAMRGESPFAFKARVQAAIDNGGIEPRVRTSRAPEPPPPTPEAKRTKPADLNLRALVGKSPPKRK